MVDVRDNFREKYKNDKICKICHTEVETQEHVVLCKEITKHANMEMDDEFELSDIFSDDVEKQTKITILWKFMETQK